jgi:uncharacterized protein YjiS (DUF1127 family)
MAAFDSSRSPLGTTGTAGLFGVLGATFTGIFGAVAQWNDARMTRNALSTLSDRELEDIGLVRGDIDRVAEGRTY